MTDNVNHPKHYLAAALTLEPIELTARLNSCLGQALQYVCRAPYKGNEIEDLEKAIFYLKKQFEIEPYFTIPAETTPYIQIFSRHATGMLKNVVNSLFTFSHVDSNNDSNEFLTYFFVDEENLRESIEIIDRRLDSLENGDAD